MGAWNSRRRRAFRQTRVQGSEGLTGDALREKQIAAIKAAGVDDLYASRGISVTNSMLVKNIRKRRAAALDWLAQNPDRVLAREAFENLRTGVAMDELR